MRKQRFLWYLSEKDGGIEGSDGSSKRARAGSNDEDAIVGKKEDEIKRERTSEGSSESGGAESPTTVTAERPHQVNKDTLMKMEVQSIQQSNPNIYFQGFSVENIVSSK